MWFSESVRVCAHIKRAIVRIFICGFFLRGGKNTYKLSGLIAFYMLVPSPSSKVHI